MTIFYFLYDDTDLYIKYINANNSRDAISIDFVKRSISVRSTYNDTQNPEIKCFNETLMYIYSAHKILILTEYSNRYLRI